MNREKKKYSMAECRRSCSVDVLLVSAFERLKLEDGMWSLTYKPYPIGISEKLFRRMMPVPALRVQCIYTCAKLSQRDIDTLPRNLQNEVMKYAAMPPRNGRPMPEKCYLCRNYGAEEGCRLCGERRQYNVINNLL